MKFAIAMGSAALMSGMVLSYTIVVSTYGVITTLNAVRPDASAS
jgi:hypothetical protein